MGGREQLAVGAVADALSVVPRTLAENAGMDGNEALTHVRAAQDDGREGVGIDVLGATVADVLAEDVPVVDPADSKFELWGAAVDLAIKLVRIDEEIPVSGELDPDEAPPLDG